MCVDVCWINDFLQWYTKQEHTAESKERTTPSFIHAKRKIKPNPKRSILYFMPVCTKHTHFIIIIILSHIEHIRTHIPESEHMESILTYRGKRERANCDDLWQMERFMTLKRFRFTHFLCDFALPYSSHSHSATIYSFLFSNISLTQRAILIWLFFSFALLAFSSIHIVLDICVFGAWYDMCARCCSTFKRTQIIIINKYRINVRRDSWRTYIDTFPYASWY